MQEGQKKQTKQQRLPNSIIKTSKNNTKRKKKYSTPKTAP